MKKVLKMIIKRSKYSKILKTKNAIIFLNVFQGLNLD